MYSYDSYFWLKDLCIILFFIDEQVLFLWMKLINDLFMI